MNLQTIHNPTVAANGCAVTMKPETASLREAVQRSLADYFNQLDGTPPADLHQLVINQVEKPLFETIMRHTGGNQSKAASLLGISRSTLRKKLAHYEIE